MAVAGKTKRDVLLEFRTTEIIDAARRVFAVRGYGGATIDAIAIEAGVAKGTVYLYFESKRELFLACLREGVEALHAEVSLQMAAAATCEAKLRAFIGGRFEYFTRNREFFRIYYTEFSQVIAGTANSQPEFQDLYEEQARQLEGVLLDGMAAGELRTVDGRRTARLIYDMVRAGLAHHILHGTEETPEAAVEDVCAFVWKGIGGK